MWPLCGQICCEMPWFVLFWCNFWIWIRIWMWIVFQNQKITFRCPKEYACQIWCWLMQRCITYWWNKSVMEARCNLWIWIRIWNRIVFQYQEMTFRHPKEYACQIWCWLMQPIHETKVWQKDGWDYIIFKMAAMAAILDFPKWSKSVVVGPKHVHAKFRVDWSSGVPSIEETKVWRTDGRTEGRTDGRTEGIS